MSEKKRFYSCDFETTTDPTDCRVWLWAARDLYSDFHYWGTDIKSFLEWAESLEKAQLSFHNLKFDGQFIIDYLEKAGYTWVDPKFKKLKFNEYSTLISDMGQWYTLTIGFKGHQIKIVDSLKLLPFKVEQIAKDFHLPMLKGSIDYSAYRAPGHKPTQEELDYIFNDVDIPALALRSLYDANMTKLTIGSCALTFYKGMTKHFDNYFPAPEYDADIRQGYRGGWTFTNPLYQGQDIGEGIVLDVNSLYPSVMADPDCLLPFGAGVWQKGELKADKFYPIFIQHLSCQFELKPRHLPTIQIKGNPLFKSTDYLASSHGCIVDLCLTSVDLKLFFEHYDVYNLEYHSGWKFKAKGAIFKDYVNHWTNVKVESKKKGDYSHYILAKLMLNSLYGKFATNPKADIKRPVLHDDMVKTTIEHEDPKKPVYLPVGMFITAWARNKTIRAAQKVFDRFLYADTDSLHLVGLEIPKELEIDKYKLGAWDHEATFKRARYLHSKCYYEEIYAEETEDGLKYTNKVTDKTKPKVTIAGLPADCHDQVTWDNFKLGAVYEGKLKPQIVPGGVCLIEVPFEIRRGFIYGR